MVERSVFASRAEMVPPAPRAREFKGILSEFSGALGDLGTLVPLAIGLIVINGVNPTTMFAVVGIAYIASGVYFRIPMPVQPLKAVAAIAVSLGLSPSIISAAGLIMGVVLLMLLVPGVLGTLARLFPRPVIRGIQLGLALLLLKAALSLVSEPRLPIPAAGWAIAAAGLMLVLVCFHRGWPGSLVILGFGLALSGILGWFAGGQGIQLGPSVSLPHLPNGGELWAALVLLVIPQIPLTVGNSIMAMEDVAKTYFGRDAKRVTPRALCISLGVANIGGGLLGGMPVCHGSAGLSAHYRFGARTRMAPVIIGAICLALALIFGGTLPAVLSMVPSSVLAIMLFITAVQHGWLVRDLKARRDYLTAAATGIATIVTGNLAIGFAVGVILHYLSQTAVRLAGRQRMAPRATAGSAVTSRRTKGMPAPEFLSAIRSSEPVLRDGAKSDLARTCSGEQSI